MRGKIRFEIADDLDVQLPSLGLEQIQHALDLIVQAARMQVQIPQPGKAEEIVQQILQPRDLLLNQFDLGQSPATVVALRFGQILRQQIHVHPDDRQRILDLMRQRSGQLGQLVVAGQQSLAQFFRTRLFLTVHCGNAAPRDSDRRNRSATNFRGKRSGRDSTHDRPSNGSTLTQSADARSAVAQANGCTIQFWIGQPYRAAAVH